MTAATSRCGFSPMVSSMKGGAVAHSAPLPPKSPALVGTDWPSSGWLAAAVVRKEVVVADVTVAPHRPVRCAIYTRKSSEEGLEQEFNSLDAQREAAEAFIMSQRQ